MIQPAPILIPDAVIAWRGYSVRGDAASVAEVWRLVEIGQRCAVLEGEVARLRGVVGRGSCAR